MRYPTLSTTTAEPSALSLFISPSSPVPIADPPRPDPHDPDPVYAAEDVEADAVAHPERLGAGPPHDPPPPEGYDPAAVAAAAEALSTNAHEAFVGPVLKLIGRRRRAGVFALGALAAGAAEAAAAPWIEADTWSAMWEWVMGTLASALGLAAAGSFAHALVDRAATHHAHDRKWRAYNHDFGSLRIEAADRLMLLDRTATAKGLGDFAARSHGLRLLNRKLKVEVAVMTVKVERFFHHAAFAFWTLLAAGAAGLAWGMIATGLTGWSHDLLALGVFVLAAAEAAVILHFGRHQIEDLVQFLAPPPDDPDPFVIVARRVDELITQVIAQNQFLRSR